ncbi:MAG: AhpC/TSA family protein [Odoribacter splanchnicus]|nr:AhpC/TSA family protein [Odoribacter splanchnicus]
MKVKKILLSVLAIVTLFSCSRKDQMKISGDIQNASKQKVYLEQLNVDQSVVVDSTETNRKGQFSFKREVTTPTFYNVRIGKNAFVTLLGEPDMHIQLKGNLEDLNNNYWVDGSEGSLWLKMLNYQLNRTRQTMDSLRNAYNALPEGKAYDSIRVHLETEWDTITGRQIKFSKDFILKHAVSPASYYALYQKFDNDNFILTPETNLHSYKIVASALKAMFPESQYTKAILKHLDLIKKNDNILRLQQLIANSETTLPEIKLPNSEGDTIALSSLKGKFVVLDFSVLGGADGRAYAAEMKKVYDKFRNRGVRIYQVCLDQNRLAWQRLVKQYGITWDCVWDADALQSRIARRWNIRTVPANFIINPKYEIVGKDLTGRRLEDRLNDLLK